MMLQVEGVTAGYDATQILFDVSLGLEQGEVLAVLGRNGMGKTTTVRTLMGLTPCWGGTMQFQGQSLRGLAPFRIAKMGVGLAPEGRQIFPSLSVEENLIATANARGASDPNALGRVRFREKSPCQ